MADAKLTEKEQSRIVNRDKLDYEPSSEGLGYEFYHAMQLNKDAIAQIDSETGKAESYGELLEKCIRTSLKLIAMGITRDDIICQCCNNNLNSCVPIISALFLGVKVAPLDPSLSLDETTHLLELVKPKVIFVGEDAINIIEDALDNLGIKCEIIIFGSSYMYTEFDDFIKDVQLGENNFQVAKISSNRDTAIILFSSGTTGLPKGICLSHYALMVQLINTVECWNFGKNLYFSNYSKQRNTNGFTVALGFMSFYWISAIGVLNCSILTGITRIICPKFEPSDAWKIIDKYRVEFVTCAPFHAALLWKVGKPEGVDGNSLKLLLTAGTTLSKKTMLALRELIPGCFITNAYGQTEISGAITMFNVSKPEDIRDQYEKPTSCGKPIPGVRCKIVDLFSHKIVGPKEPGELRYKADFIMNGYYNLDSSFAFDSDGWIKTGDVAYYDEKHRFFVMDRIKDVFKYKCWHIIPMMIEHVLKEHSAVKDAVVIGIPDKNPDIGELPMAIVTLHKGTRDRVLDTAIEEYENKNDLNMDHVVLNENTKDRVIAFDIEEFANKKLPDKAKIRAGVKIIEELPRTPTGKPKRNELREMILKQNDEIIAI